MKLNLSIVIPVRNEAYCLEKNLSGFIDYFGKHRQIDKFEILLVENGSSDKTLSIAREITPKYKNLSLFSVKGKNLGIALSTGIKKSKYPYIYFDAIDNPFDFQDLEKFMGAIKNFDLIFASKNHPESRYEKRPVRKIASIYYSFFTHILFGLHLTDTQGTFLGRKDKLLSILPCCTSKSAFFQTQLAIYAAKYKLRISEVPIDYIPQNQKSNFSVFTDGMGLVFELFREKIRQL